MGTLLKSFIVDSVLIFSDYLETESNAVMQVKSKKAVQTIVPVIERVNAEKDQDEDGHQE
jgi:hypothetical protein